MDNKFKFTYSTASVNMMYKNDGKDFNAVGLCAFILMVAIFSVISASLANGEPIEISNIGTVFIYVVFGLVVTAEMLFFLLNVLSMSINGIKEHVGPFFRRAMFLSDFVIGATLILMGFPILGSLVIFLTAWFSIFWGTTKETRKDE